MIKLIKKFQIKLTPFDATKTWEMSAINNQDLLLHDTGSSTLEIPVALEFIDFGSMGDIPFINSECNIALEQQDDDLVNTRLGLKTSGLFYPDKDPINEDGTYKRVVYSQVNTMFYNDTKNPTQTWGINNIDFTLSKTKRRISDEFRLFDVPQDIYGDKIIPKTVMLHDYSSDANFDITDDGNGNLMAGTNLFSKFQKIGDFQNSFVVGSDYYCGNYWNFLPTASSYTIYMTGSDTSSFNVGLLSGDLKGYPYTDSSTFNVGMLSGITNTSPFVETSSMDVGLLAGWIGTFLTSSVIDSNSINVGLLFGSTNQSPIVEDPTFLVGVLTGSLQDAIMITSSIESASVSLIFYTGSVTTVVFVVSGSDSGSYDTGLYTGSVITTILVSSGSNDSSSYDTGFYTGSLVTMVIPSSQNEAGSTNVGMLSGILV